MQKGRSWDFIERSSPLPISFERSGAYGIQHAYGQQAGPDPAVGSPPGRLVPGSGDGIYQNAPQVYTLKIELSAGEQMLSLAYLNNYNVQDHPVAELTGDRNLYR